MAEKKLDANAHLYNRGEPEDFKNSKLNKTGKAALKKLMSEVPDAFPKAKKKPAKGKK